MGCPDVIIYRLNGKMVYVPPPKTYEVSRLLIERQAHVLMRRQNLAST